MARLKDKIGQMIMTGIRGHELSREERATIQEYRFGGFILFQHNCSDPPQILSLCRSLWQTGREHPPFIAIDEEGGRAHRLPKPFTHFPPAATLGKNGDVDVAYSVGRATAVELSLAGINLDFAPVLDVRSNPNNPVIGDRSFGCTPEAVTKIATAWIRGVTAGGLIACGKHFPGHGDTDKDSHVELPIVEKTLEQLRIIELVPFVHVCRDRIDALMTAHVLFRSLDPNYPATLSHKIVTRMLRHELAFDGIVFSDDMGMRAVTAGYTHEDAAALAVCAGVDILMYCHNLTAAVRAAESITRAAEQDPRIRDRIEESYRRIECGKARRLPAFTGAAEQELTRELARLDHQRIVDEIYGSL